jgi:hypothetical protein
MKRRETREAERNRVGMPFVARVERPIADLGEAPVAHFGLR